MKTIKGKTVSRKIMVSAIITLLVLSIGIVKAEDVDLTVDVVGAITEDIVGGTTGTVNATEVADTEVDYDAAGDTNMTVIGLVTCPEEEPSFSTIGKYVDVYVPDPSQLNSITIKIYYNETDIIGLDEPSLVMYYWNNLKLAWLRCSHTGVNTTANYIWALLDDSIPTKPGLDYLLGGPFAPGVPEIILTPDEGFATTIAGGGFTPLDTITIEWEETVMSTYPGEIVCDGVGEFDFAMITALEQDAGDYEIYAIDEHDHTASATFTVPDMTGEPGDQGVQGLQGDPGETGATGPQGDQGLTGAIGPQGDQGLTGATGPQGDQGLTGATGPQGDQGPLGPQGPDGAEGPQGPLGPQGPDGAEGPQGDKGSKGAAGDDGSRGATGSQGEQGEIGPPGPEGDVGPVGSEGEQGLPGVSGEAGEPGVQGSTGPAGPPGPPGDTGEQGPAGKPAPVGVSVAGVAVGGISLLWLIALALRKGA